MWSIPTPEAGRRAAACAAALLVGLAAVPAAAQGPPREPRGPELRVYAHTLKHQQAHEALALVQPLLTPRGTVEVQPGGNTLVVREASAVVDRIQRLLEDFDRPPQALRFDIQIVRAGPSRGGISPPLPDPPRIDEALSEERVQQLRKLLRYDDYRVLATAGVTSRQGEDVTYALGETYSVSFRSGLILAGRRVKLEGFRILKQAPRVSDKGRRLEPRELFRATLNLWIDQPFNLVLAHDESRQEALMVMISCHRESGGDAQTPTAGPPISGSIPQRPTADAPLKRPAEGGR